MGSILVGIKRFFTNKNTITIIAILLCLFILYWAYNKRIEDATSPKSVVVSTSELGPRTLITSEMVTIKKIPGKMIEGAFQSTSEVIGKYVSEDSVIPSGGLFYKTMVKTWDELPKSVYGDIPDGNTIVALSVSMDSTYGNSIYPGNYIDLYYQNYNDKGKLMLQKFIESIKVLAVTDSAGKSVFETNEKLAQPAFLIFSVPEDLHLLLRKASYLSGTIFPVPRNANYSNGNPKETRVVCTKIKEYILDQTIDVDVKDKKKNIQINTDNGNVSADVIE